MAETKQISATVIDHTSPYHLSSGDLSVVSITHVILTKDNYATWARAIGLSLKARRKYGFIDGSLMKPAEPEKLADWIAVNSMVVSWILRSIEPKLLGTIPFHEEARSLWLYFEKRFSVANGPRIQQLRASIADCKQASDECLEDYYAKLMGLYDELARLKPMPSCECGKCTCSLADKFAKDRDEEIFHQFLLGVDREKYGVVRSTLLSQSPLPDLDRAYQTLLQEECVQNMGQLKSDLAEAHIFALPQNRARVEDKKRLHCKHCGKVGHDQLTCFKIHGYPEWWFEKNRLSRAQHIGKPQQAGGAGILPTPSAASVSPHPNVSSSSTSIYRGRVTTGAGAGAGAGARAHAIVEQSSTCDGGMVKGDTSLNALTPNQFQSLIRLLNDNDQRKDRMMGPVYGDPDWSR